MRKSIIFKLLALVKLIKRQKEKIQIIKMRDEKGDIIIDTEESQEIIGYTLKICISPNWI